MPTKYRCQLTDDDPLSIIQICRGFAYHTVLTRVLFAGDPVPRRYYTDSIPPGVRFVWWLENQFRSPRCLMRPLIWIGNLVTLLLIVIWQSKRSLNVQMSRSVQRVCGVGVGEGGWSRLVSSDKLRYIEASDLSRWPSPPIRSLRYIVTCTRIRLADIHYNYWDQYHLNVILFIRDVKSLLKQCLLLCKRSPFNAEFTMNQHCTAL